MSIEKMHSVYEDSRLQKRASMTLWWMISHWLGAVVTVPECVRLVDIGWFNMRQKHCDHSFLYLTRMMEFISGGVTCLALSMAPMTCC